MEVHITRRFIISEIEVFILMTKSINENLA